MGRKRIYADDAAKQKAYRERKRNNLELRDCYDITSPPLRYHGAKWRIADWVISNFPPHTAYIEPFCGGAGVLLQKPLSSFEVINDLDNNVINFFDVLRERPDDLIRAIELTPYARAELERARRPADDPLEKARRFYVLSWQQHHPGRMDKNTGWRVMYRNTRNWGVVQDWNRTSHLYDVAARLKHVQIECRDALQVIEHYDTPKTLFYIDPPYMKETRSDNWGGRAYRFEMNDEDHQQLATLLHRVQGMVVLSGYPSVLYDELFRNWQRIERTTANVANQSVTECLWLNPNATSINHLPLFSLENQK